MSLVGAIYGALLVNFGKTYFSEVFPDLWLFCMAALFIGVTVFFPQGLAGLYADKFKPWIDRLRKSEVAGGQSVQDSGTTHAADSRSDLPNSTT
jgi:urea transport system permease protein